MSKKTTVSFNAKAFALQLRLRLSSAGLSTREASRQSGVSYSTIHRIIKHHTTPDVNSLVRLLEWLELELQDYVKKGKS